MLSAPNRLRSSKDFARTTKIGLRATTASLVLYLRVDDQLDPAPQIGFIISKVVGGSVTRHRIARQLRHAVADQIQSLPGHSQLVIRVIKSDGDFITELAQAITKIIKKSEVKS